jgi:hypothetical protein
MTPIIYEATAKIEALCATNWSPMWIVPGSNFQHAAEAGFMTGLKSTFLLSGAMKSVA